MCGLSKNVELECKLLGVQVSVMITLIAEIISFLQSADEKDDELDEEQTTNEVIRSATIMAQFSQNVLGNERLVSF